MELLKKDIIEIFILNLNYQKTIVSDYRLLFFQEYAGSTANILTAVMCAVLFPDKFEFTIYIMLSMGCLFTGIYLYESQKVKPKSSSVPNQSIHSSNETKT